MRLPAMQVGQVSLLDELASPASVQLPTHFQQALVSMGLKCVVRLRTS